MKSTMIHARVEPNLKSEVEDILKTIGLNTTQAIALFYNQIKLHKGLPFEVKIPNEETAKAIKDARSGKNMTKMSIEELKKELNA